MPGDNDPTGHWLPQQPSPACMFPQAARYSTLNRVPNPYQATIGGRVVLGSSGQPVDDLRKYTRRPAQTTATAAAAAADESDASSSSSSSLSSSAEEGGRGESPEVAARECVEYLEEMLAWRHMAPTAPDTLDVYPHFNTDPFVIEDTPHVFFAANQPAFEAKKVKVGPSQDEVLCVSVPRFSTTGEAVIVDLKTLDCAPIRLRGYSHPAPPAADDNDSGAGESTEVKMAE